MQPTKTPSPTPPPTNNTDTISEPGPQRFRFKREYLGSMEVVEKILNGLTIGSAGSIAFGNDPAVSGLLTLVLAIVRMGLAAIISRTKVSNPI